MLKTLKSRLTGMALWLACGALSSCSSSPPIQPPQVIACPKPVVDRQLLVPATLPALGQLKDSLSLPPGNVSKPPTN